ncbi:MAG: DNA-methyltransferase, partial [Blastocatellia bacterium]
EKVPSVRNGIYAGTKFNENGKNPGDVWGDIKQLTYKSHELLSRDVLHTIQKPLKLMERLVKASSNPEDLVLDPFCGVGTVLAACEKLGRRYLGFEINADYIELAKQRISRIRNEEASLLFSK